MMQLANFIQGLQIFYKYEGQSKFSMAIDEGGYGLCLGLNCNDIISDADKDFLEKLGFEINDEYDTYYVRV